MRHPARIAALCCALTLAGCIASTEPILNGAQPVLGERLRLQLYSMRNGFADEPERATFIWDGKHYVYAGGNAKGMDDFTLHPFEGNDFIAQSAPKRGKSNFEYALVHRLADGVYRVIAIDEEDAEPGARGEYCATAGKGSCLIRSRQALMVFARAAAARKKDDGGLAIRLVDEKARKR